MARLPRVRRRAIAARALPAAGAGLLACGVLLALAGPASAQVCVASGPSSTRCSLLLSRPRAYTVHARLRVLAGDPREVPMRVSVNGRPCGALQARDGGWMHASCRVALPAGTSYIDAGARGGGAGAGVTGASGVPGAPASDGRYRPVGVEVAPDDRLADLPREARSLYPRHSHPFLWTPWQLRFP